MYYIIVFKNTYDAMNGEEYFKKNKLSYRIMPTPTIITQSCGICIRTEDEIVINTVIKLSEIEYKNIYNKDREGYKLIE